MDGSTLSSRHVLGDRSGALLAMPRQLLPASGRPDQLRQVRSQPEDCQTGGSQPRGMLSRCDDLLVCLLTVKDFYTPFTLKECEIPSFKRFSAECVLALEGHVLKPGAWASSHLLIWLQSQLKGE